MSSTATTLTPLRHRWEFGRAYRHGKKVWNHAFVVYVLPTPDDAHAEQAAWRYGVTATKKIGDAVRRNRGRRLVRESLRLSTELIRDGQDIIVVIRRPALTLKCQEAQRLLLDLLARGGALKRNATSAARRAAFSRSCFPATRLRRAPSQEAAEPHSTLSREAGR